MRAAIHRGATGTLEHERQGTAAYLAVHDLEGFEVRLNFFALISSVEMRRRMVVIKHPDDDSVKTTEFGNGWLFLLKLQRPVQHHRQRS